MLDATSCALLTCWALVAGRCWWATSATWTRASARWPYSKGQALADEFGIQFFETSAKSNVNVDEACSRSHSFWF